MYETFFEMGHTPLINSVPVENLYMSSMLDETFSLPSDKFQVLYLSDSKLTPRWFYKGLLDQLGVEAKFYRGDSKRQLHMQLEVIRGVQGKTVVTRTSGGSGMIRGLPGGQA